MRAVILALALSAAAFAAPAVAGIVITSETVGRVLSNGKSVLYLEPDRMRIDTPRGIVIFRVDQNTAYALNAAEKAFRRLTADRLPQAASTNPTSPAKTEFRKVGGTANYGEWSCEGVEQLLNGHPIALLCVARLSALGLSEDDLGASRRFESFIRQAVPQMAVSPAGIDPRALEQVVGYLGFAVHMKIVDSDIETTIRSVEKKTLAASQFEVPAGYREQPMPSLPPLH